MTATARHLRDDRAERVVLSGCLREPGLVLPRLREMGLTADAFYWHAHGLAYRTLADLYNAGSAGLAGPGPYGLWHRLRLAGELAELGPTPAAWILGVWDADPTGMHAVPEAVRVMAFARRRRAVHAANELIRDALGGHLDETDRRLALLVG